MTNPLRCLAALALVAATPGPAAADQPPEEPGTRLIPLRGEIIRSLPLGMRIEVAPGFVVASGEEGSSPVGFNGRATVRGWRDLVMIRSEVQSVHLEDEWKTEWSIRMNLGGEVELASKRIARELLGGVRAVGRRVL